MTTASTRQLLQKLTTRCDPVAPSVLYATCYCTTIALGFVVSLYALVPTSVRRLPRSDARQIKWRMAAVLVATILSIASFPVCFCSDNNIYDDSANRKGASALALVGWSTFTIGPLLHAVALYTGPIAATIVTLIVAPPVSSSSVRSDTLASSNERSTLRSAASILSTVFVYPAVKVYYLLLQPFLVSCRDNKWGALRNLLVAPLAEEAVYRGVIVPPLILAPSLSPTQVVWITPLFFGAAHFHHAYTKYYHDRIPMSLVLAATLLQFLYTTLFGAYVSYCFIRTASIGGVLLVHIFCNLMGLPKFHFWTRKKSNVSLYKYRYFLMMAHFAGLVAFGMGFKTNANNTFWSRSIFSEGTSLLQFMGKNNNVPI